MTVKREVWVLEHDNGAPAEWHDKPIAHLKPECCNEREALLAAEHGNRITKYIPAPVEVEGWPKQEGWYWAQLEPAQRPNDITIVRIYGNEGLLGDVFFEPTDYPRARLWGPLLRPEATP